MLRHTANKNKSSRREDRWPLYATLRLRSARARRRGAGGRRDNSRHDDRAPSRGWTVALSSRRPTIAARRASVLTLGASGKMQCGLSGRLDVSTTSMPGRTAVRGTSTRPTCGPRRPRAGGAVVVVAVVQARFGKCGGHGVDAGRAALRDHGAGSLREEGKRDLCVTGARESFRLHATNRILREFSSLSFLGPCSRRAARAT